MTSTTAPPSSLPSYRRRRPPRCRRCHHPPPPPAITSPSPLLYHAYSAILAAIIPRSGLLPMEELLRTCREIIQRGDNILGTACQPNNAASLIVEVKQQSTSFSEEKFFSTTSATREDQRQQFSRKCKEIIIWGRESLKEAAREEQIDLKDNSAEDNDSTVDDKLAKLEESPPPPHSTGVPAPNLHTGGGAPAPSVLNDNGSSFPAYVGKYDLIIAVATTPTMGMINDELSVDKEAASYFNNTPFICVSSLPSSLVCTVPRGNTPSPTLGAKLMEEIAFAGGASKLAPWSAFSHPINVDTLLYFDMRPPRLFSPLSLLLTARGENAPVFTSRTMDMGLLICAGDASKLATHSSSLSSTMPPATPRGDGAFTPTKGAPTLMEGVAANDAPWSTMSAEVTGVIVAEKSYFNDKPKFFFR
ncbi:hypothetical protein ACP70R_040974 [Stipagrostis hirtigluma subsp. patula]